MALGKDMMAEGFPRNAGRRNEKGGSLGAERRQDLLRHVEKQRFQGKSRNRGQGQGASRQTGSLPANLGEDCQASRWQEPGDLLAVGDAMSIGMTDLSGGKLWMKTEAQTRTLPCLQLLDTALAPRATEYPLRGGRPKEGYFPSIHSLMHLF